MSNLEQLIRRDLDQLAVLPPDLRPDWTDVQRRVRNAAVTADAEPKGGLYRRMRRRPVLALLVVLVIVAIPVSALAIGGRIPLADWPFFRFHSLVPRAESYPTGGAGVVVIKQGVWDGQGWDLVAFRRSGHGGELCVGVTDTRQGLPFPTAESGLACGPPVGRPIKAGYGNEGPKIAPWYSDGIATARISEVEIYLADGTVVRTPTIPAPRTLGLAISFYVTQLPSVACPGSSLQRLAGRITKYVGLSNNGAVITTAKMPLPPPGVPLVFRCLSRASFGSGFPTEPLVPSSAMHLLKQVLRVTALGGAMAKLSITPPVTLRDSTATLRERSVTGPGPKGRCWRIVFSLGRAQSGCYQLYPTGPEVSVLGVQPVGRSIFVVAQTTAPVTHIRLLFADGEAITGSPVGGIVVFTIPQAHLTNEPQKVTLTGLNSRGQKVGSNTWAYYRVRPTDRLPEPQ